MRARRIVLGLLAGLSLSLPALAADPCATPVAEAQAKYVKLLAEARQDPGKADFAEMRVAYLYSEHYDPAGLDAWNEPREAIIALIKENQFDKAAKAIERVIEVYPLSIDAHSLARHVYDKLGDEKRRAFHSEFGRLLFRALIDSGDGTTQMTPFLVLSVGEEYSILRILGLNPVKQSTLHLKDRVLDQLDVRHGADGTTGTLYFDVTEAFNFMGCKISGQKSEQKK